MATDDAVLGPVGLVFYAWFGRAGRGQAGAVRMWQITFKGATHCGAGCALGDFIGDWFAFATGLQLFGRRLPANMPKRLHWHLFGIAFKYVSVAPMRYLDVRSGLVAAAKIDTASLLAYQVGMFAGMAYVRGRFPPLNRPPLVTGS